LIRSSASDGSASDASVYAKILLPKI